MNNTIGQFLGRYQIVEQLGEGGMATVYRAFDTRLERDVAVKVIRTERGADTQFLSRFEREARALAKLSHPNIVHVNDYGEQAGVPYVVMDYLPGGTLKDKMGAALPYQEAARLVAPIAHALHFAHQMHIIHRDVKPANILLTKSGIPMLSDFGIAKILEEKTSELTGTGVGIGTPEYMAPEQGAGSKVDYRADIYALGVVFYELVTGRKPFRADTPIATVLKHMSEPLPRPSGFVRDLPDAVEKVIFKALAKKPEDRYADMDAFANALDRLAVGQAASVPEVAAPKEEQAAKKSMLIGGVSVALFVAGIGLLILCVMVYGYIRYGRPGKPTAIAGQQVATLTTSPSQQNSTTQTNNGQNPTLPGQVETTPGVVNPQESPTQDTSNSSQTTTSTGADGVTMLTQMKQGHVNSGQTVVVGTIDVPHGAQVASFVVMLRSTSDVVSLLVVDPDNKMVDKNYQGGMTSETNANDNKIMNVNIQKPIPGKWQVSVVGDTVASGGVDFTAMMSCDNPQLPAGVLANVSDVIGSGGAGLDDFYVAAGTKTIVATVSWTEPGVKLEVELTDPDEIYMNENFCTTVDQPCPGNAEFSNTTQTNTITITNPKPGWWRLGVDGKGNKTGKDISFTITVSGP